MERIRKKGKQHDNTDVTFWILPTTDENWQACSDLSESVCNSYLLYGLCRSQLEIVLGSGNSCVIKPRRTSTRAQRVHGAELFMFCLVSKALSQISFSI